MVNIFASKDIKTFAIQHHALNRITSSERSLRPALVKVYLLLANGTRPYFPYRKDEQLIKRLALDMRSLALNTGLSLMTVRKCQKSLQDLGLISCERDERDSRRYVYEVLDVRTNTPFTTDGYKPGSEGGYFRCPQAFVDIPTPKRFKRDSGTATLCYLLLLAQADRHGDPYLDAGIGTLATKANLTPKTVTKALRLLTEKKPLIRVKRGTMEILDPFTGQSLEKRSKPPYFRAADGQPVEEKELSRGCFETYFSHYFPGLDIAEDQHDHLHCPFHEDEHPSFSLNLAKCQFHCNAAKHSVLSDCA